MPPKVTSKSTANGGSGNAAGSEDLQKYQKMTDLEHILKKPDTYIGTNEPTETMEYVMDAAVSSPSISSTAIESDDATASVVPGAAAPSLTRRNITYIPGLYKLFDEGMVNMRDHVVRQAQAVADGKPDALPVTTLEVEIDPADGTIHMTNDGNGIDVAQHPEHKLWIPEMIFSNLKSGSNFDDTEQRTTGGRNGYGAKLTNIFSKKFLIIFQNLEY
jgi:DNA topoisomerase-2